MPEPTIKVSVIVAAAEGGVIGINNQLPWHLPADLAHFKRLTLGKPMVMGRRTFESIGKALPGRTSIVLTHQPTWQAESALLAATLDQALALAYADARSRGAEEIMIIGGSAVFEQALPLCDRLYLTLVNAKLEGDTFFPSIDASQWDTVSRQENRADGRHAYDYTFIQMDRRLADNKD